MKIKINFPTSYLGSITSKLVICMGDNMGKWAGKSFVIMVMLITIVINQTLAKAEEDSSESVIQTVLDDNKTKKFLKENKTLLKKLQDQEETILYSLEPYHEYPFQLESSKVDRTGVFPQMIDFFEQLTEVTFEQYSETGTKEEMMDKLTTGELKLLLGITMSKQAKAEIASKNKEVKIVAFKDDMFLDSFVLIGHVLEEEEEVEVDEEYTQEMLPYYYWGCLEDQYVELAQSELLNHTVTYNSIQELEAAYQEGIIQGMVITQGLERYYTVLDTMEYSNIKDFSLKARKYYCTAKDDLVLNKLLPKMIQLYLSFYDEFFIKELPVLEVSEKPHELWILTYLPILGICSFTVAFLSGIIFVMKRQRERKKLLRILKRIPDRIQKEQEVLFVLIKKSKIQSKHQFRVFGLEQKHPRKTMRMVELMKQIGFDFKKHYAFLVKNQEKEFTCSFDLYIRGVAYSYEEVGIYQEDVIVSKIYRKEK